MLQRSTILEEKWSQATSHFHLSTFAASST